MGAMRTPAQDRVRRPFVGKNQDLTPVFLVQKGSFAQENEMTPSGMNPLSALLQTKRKRGKWVRSGHSAAPESSAVDAPLRPSRASRRGAVI